MPLWFRDSEAINQSILQTGRYSKIDDPDYGSNDTDAFSTAVTVRRRKSLLTLHRASNKSFHLTALNLDFLNALWFPLHCVVMSGGR